MWAHLLNNLKISSQWSLGNRKFLISEIRDSVNKLWNCPKYQGGPSGNLTCSKNICDVKHSNT